MKKNCIMCNSNKTIIVQSNYQGYVEGNLFDIYKCFTCDSHFISNENFNNDIYNIIYSSNKTYGYDRYYYYYKSIKSKKNPLKFLAYNEPTYYPVYKYLKNKNNLNILEIGCGYGYLTYALNQKGFHAIGIDIAANAVSLAKENFGDYFFVTDLGEYTKKTTYKFDLIIATEVVEHLTDPHSFIENCISLLNEGGKIILTTPNKDNARKNTIWETDLPPVHVIWTGKKGISMFAEQHKLSPTFIDFSKYFSKNENRLVRHLISLKEDKKEPILSKEGLPFKVVLKNHNIFHRIVAFSLHKIPMIRFPSNIIYNIIINKETTLGVILEIQ